MTKIQLSKKQKLALDTLDDPTVTEIYYGGSAGSGKTLMLCIWMVLQCRQYPGIRIGLGRKELTRLKQTTLHSLLREAHPMMNISGAVFNYQDQKGLVTYANGSTIQLIDLARQPSDPDYDTLGSLNLTHVVIDEGGEIVLKAKNVLGSRKNRYMNKEYGLVGKTVITGNPSQNFTREEYYEPYKVLGGGNIQKWESGNVEVNGVLVKAHKAFIKALPTDNPFIPQNYLEVLKQLPPQERKRLYEGNWDYADDDDALFKSTLIDRSIAYDIEFKENPQIFIGVDVADKGVDKTMVSLGVDGILKHQKRLVVDTTGEKPISELYSLELIKFAQQNGLTPAQASQIAIEGNGVGVGMRDFMRSKGWFIAVYEATSKTRSQAYWDLHIDMDAGNMRISSEVDTMTELRRQLLAHTYEFNERLEPVVIGKKQLKETLGHSPDEADSFMIMNWARNGGNRDPKQDASRIIF